MDIHRTYMLNPVKKEAPDYLTSCQALTDLIVNLHLLVGLQYPGFRMLSPAINWIVGMGRLPRLAVANLESVAPWLVLYKIEFKGTFGFLTMPLGHWFPVALVLR